MSEPARIFYAYSHRDDRLRARLAKHLTALKRQGLIEDWHDREIGAGEDWGQAIHRQLESAEIILLLISADFLASGYCYDVEMTRALERHEAGEARVVPVILRPSDWRSAPFARLQALPQDGKPVTSWRDRDEAFTEISQGIRSLVGELRRSSPAPPGSGPPSLRRPLLETGSMPADSPFYISRGELEQALERLESSDPTVVVRGYRQSGKSSLLTRLHIRAIEKGQKSCYLNFQDLDESSFTSLNQLFLELGLMMSEELEARADPEEHWSDRVGAKHNLTKFVQNAILATAETSVQILFDEVDLIFDFPESRQSVFSMLRSWHNRRATDSKGRWKKLRLVIAHATDPALWISDPKQSPFNVGLGMTLEDFGRDQVLALNHRYGQPLAGESEVVRLMDLVAGHPYLLRLAISTLIRNHWTLDDLEQAAISEKGPFSSHLRRYLSLLAQQEDLKAAVRQILDHGACRDEMSFQRLWAAGLIEGDLPSEVRMRCRLYHEYFGRRL